VNARFYKSNNELTAADRAFLEAKAAENAAIKALRDHPRTRVGGRSYDFLS
jgi:hypothetical protein